MFCQLISQWKFVQNINIFSYLGPSTNRNLACNSHLGPRFTLLRDWRPVSGSVSHVIGWRKECVPSLSCMIGHLFLRINWCVCQVSCISILCLVMFGLVSIADVFLPVFSYICWIWVQVTIWYANSESTSTIPFRVSCSKLLPVRFAWRAFLATIVGGVSFLWLISVADAEDTGFLKDVSVNNVFVAIFLESKTGHTFCFSKNTHISMQYAMYLWWFWWYLIMLDVLRFKVYVYSI